MRENIGKTNHFVQELSQGLYNCILEEIYGRPAMLLQCENPEDIAFKISLEYKPSQELIEYLNKPSEEERVFEQYLKLQYFTTGSFDFTMDLHSEEFSNHIEDYKNWLKKSIPIDLMIRSNFYLFYAVYLSEFKKINKKLKEESKDEWIKQAFYNITYLGEERKWTPKTEDFNPKFKFNYEVQKEYEAFIDEVSYFELKFSDFLERGHNEQFINKDIKQFFVHLINSILLDDMKEYS